MVMWHVGGGAWCGHFAPTPCLIVYLLEGFRKIMYTLSRLTISGLLSEELTVWGFT